MKVDIVRIISVTKHPKGDRPRPGHKRVEAIVKIGGELVTRHVDTQDEKVGLLRTIKPTTQWQKENREFISGMGQRSSNTTSSTSRFASPRSRHPRFSNTRGSNTSNWSSGPKGTGLQGCGDGAPQDDYTFVRAKPNYHFAFPTALYLIANTYYFKTW